MSMKLPHGMTSIGLVLTRRNFMSHRLAPFRFPLHGGAAIAIVLALLGAALMPASAANASTASTWATTTFGTFAPATVSGRGASVVSLPAGAKAGLLLATHDGRSNFIVQTLDAANEVVEYAAVNEIGRFSGTGVFGLESFYFGDATRLSVRADGNWTITIAPISQAAEFPGSGVGGGVYLYSGGTSDLTLTHVGTSNFQVETYKEGLFGWDLVVNEIGNYNGTVPLAAGPSVLVVTADGAWTASRRELAPPVVTTPPVVVAPPVVVTPYVFPPTTTPTVTTPTVKKTAPNKPKKPRITTKTKSSVKVVWSKPNNGGAAITKYKLRLYKGSKLVKTVTVKASNRAAKFSKLKSKTGYKISVQAGNKLGYSKVSNKVSLKTL